MTGSGTIGDIKAGWSVSEDATPVDISNTDGGTGAVRLAAKANADSKFIINNTAVLAHDKLGAVTGMVGDVTISGATTSFGIAPYLSLLDTDATAPPSLNITLSSVFQNYVNLVTNLLTINWQATSNPIRIYPGWEGNVWAYLKQLCAMNGVEIVANGYTLTVRDINSAAPFPLENHEPVDINLNVQASGNFVDLTYQQPVEAAYGYKYNWASNPSVETNATGYSYSAYPSAFANGRITTKGYSGTCSYRLSINLNNTSSAGVDSEGDLSGSISYDTDVSMIPVATPVLIGSKFANDYIYDFSGSPSTHVYNYTINFVATWKNSVGTTIQTNVGTSVTNPAGSDTTWRNMYVTATVPANAVTVTLTWSVNYYIYIIAGPGGILPPLPSQLNFYVDAILITDGTTDQTYFDGNSGGAVSWLGTANNSISQRVLPSLPIYSAYTDDNNVLSIGLNETSTTTVATNSYPLTLVQPLPTDTVPINAGEYYITSSEGTPVPAAEWVALGGKVEAAIGDIPGTIDIKITGPSVDAAGHTAPYYLAQSDGTNQFATLILIGTGVVTNPQTIRVGTGADPTKTSNEIAATVDSPFIGSVQDAYTAAGWVITRAAGPVIKLSTTVATNQLTGFGVTTGSRISYQDSIYRITSIDIGNVSTQIEAEWHVLTSETEAIWAGYTSGQRDANWAGFDEQDKIVAPLRKVI